ncbi:3-deoxy-manno-octulosonate cytidylyltransferase [Candidatus Omnitrophota bacterium]
MDVIGIIPARWGSTRFEGKVLADLCGKPVVQHVWENAKKAKTLDELLIASDNEKIMKAVKAFGGKAIFTSPAQPSGTDRLAEVVNPLDVKIVVNIQGDEPLVRPIMIDNLVMALEGEKSAQMATMIKRIEDPEEITNPNCVKVVTDKSGYALYFSRSPIPYDRSENGSRTKGPVYYKHIGLYAFTKDFLFTFRKLPHSALEKTEKLEQLRVLEYGHKIKTVETRFDTVGIDTAEDLEKVRGILKKNG